MIDGPKTRNHLIKKTNFYFSNRWHKISIASICCVVRNSWINFLKRKTSYFSAIMKADSIIVFFCFSFPNQRLSKNW